VQNACPNRGASKDGRARRRRGRRHISFEVLGHLICIFPRIISSDPKSAIESRVPLIFWGRRASPNGPFYVWTIAYSFLILYFL